MFNSIHPILAEDIVKVNKSVVMSICHSMVADEDNVYDVAQVTIAERCM